MKTKNQNCGFALIATLVLMALILVVVVAYLGNTRSDRSTSSVYANRLRAKMIADSALTAATKLLHDNTKNGNYITAMPAPLPAPAPLRTELYRPDNTIIPDDFLQLNNAIGEILASRVVTNPPVTPTSQVDFRPTATLMPAPAPGGSFGLSEPGAVPSSADSFDFNQIVRVGNNSNGRLVNPDARAAFGQWIRVRNTAGELIGRYAFFVEDESMKVNVNTAGNNLGSSGSNLRVNDLTFPASTGPGSQIQEVDPSAVLAAPPANRAVADSILTALGAAGSRLATKSTIALLDEWKTSYPDYAHMITVLSSDDNTTPRGWQRLDLNALVAGASGNAAKAAAAHRIADWIRDAWVGPALAGLQEYQLFGNERLRLQLAANIVDYIDSDNIPTDLGDIIPDGYTMPIPVIGIEKIPYLTTLFITFQASGRPSGGNTATMKMKMRFNFSNPYESPLDLTSYISRIEITGVPVILKQGSVVFDHESQVFSIPVNSLRAVTGTGFSVPPGTDGTSNSGARSFETDWLVPGESVTFPTVSGKPNFESGEVQVRVFANDVSGEVRVDSTAAVTTDTPRTGYTRSGSNTVGDFLLDADTQARQVSAVYLHEAIVDITLTQLFGDPRYRPDLRNGRWRRLNFTDDEALSERLDMVDSNPRLYASDWYDHIADRPLAFLRNGPMLSVGELGNVAACEYPWRTLYLQQPERPSNGGGTTTSSQVATRRSGTQDYRLIDLFRTEPSISRNGSINVNGQQRFGTQQKTVATLFLGVPVSAQNLTQTAVDCIVTNTGSASISTVSDRLIAAGPPIDNNPRRPFFQIGELAPVLSRIISTSENSTTGSPSRSTTVYSALRTSPTNRSELNANYQRDMQVEQPFRKVSNSITTRGNIFRVLYVGQAIKDIPRSGIRDGIVNGPEEIVAEYLGEAFIERQSIFQPDPSNPNIVKTSDSKYKIVADRVITE